ncbi:hypothetical protein KKF91_16145 [Myxococcota bacterium]|nr:hypothetical protein [Myxococcota bacterium]MBU1432072.1 hypothetical protein [Myxococcota bacterium]MBU1897786.1 hypothetical protein [Myxococcota bacterium]
MAATLSLSLQGEILTARLSTSAGPLEHRCALNGIEGLLARVGGERPGAAVAAGQQLGRALFDGAFAAPLRAALDEGVLGIEAEGALLAWPWELLWDPQSRRAPISEGIELVRLVPGPEAAPRHPPRGALVVAQARGSARLEALIAATRNLARKLELDVQPVKARDAAALRRALDQGQLFVHLEPLIEGGQLKLDGGALELTALGLDGRTHLALLGGVDPGLAGALRLRQAGVMAVLSRQLHLRPNEGGLVDREIYRALANGGSLVDAARRARQALSRISKESPIWAAPALFAASLEVALAPFPAVEISRDAPSRAATRAEASASGWLGLPVPADSFIRETISALQAGEGADEATLKARTLAMRRLGGGTATPPPLEKNLSPELRTARLSDHFINLIERADLPLNAPPDMAPRLAEIARACDVTPDQAQLAALALLSSPLVGVEAPSGSASEALIEALATRLFGFYPSFVHASAPDLLRGPDPERHPHERGGPLWRAAAMSWSGEGLRPFDPAAPPPQRRAHVFALDARGAWRSFLGRWLIITDAQAMEREALSMISSALRRGIWAGIEGDRPYQMPLPADFRVILIGEGLDAQALGGAPIIELPAAHTTARLLAEVERGLGPAGDATEAATRLRRAGQLSALLNACATVTTIPTALALNAARLSLPFEGADAAAFGAVKALLLRPWARGQRHAIAEALERAWMPYFLEEDPEFEDEGPDLSAILGEDSAAPRPMGGAFDDLRQRLKRP